MTQLTATRRISFFSAQLDPLTMAETLAHIDQVIAQRTPVQHVVVNVAKLVTMEKDPELRNAVNGCGLINADGTGIVWGARFLGLPVPERVAGIDLMENLIRLAAEKNYGIYFLGATKDIVEKVASHYKTLYPALPVKGYRDGYFKEDEEASVVNAIRKSGADILFVAISSPKKELFLNKHLRHLNVSFAMGVGGSFDVVAGKVKRAPRWMQQSGLEWFYRLLQEPRRMWRRYLTTNLKYAGMLAGAKLKRSRKSYQR